MHTRYFQAGGLAEDVPRGFYAECRKFVEWMPKARRRLRGDPRRATRSGSSAREGIGLLSADDAIALGQSGPVLRASGVDWDLRRDAAVPRVSTSVDFGVPVYPNGDVYDRYRVRMDEMRESVRIVAQCSPSTGCPREPWIADDRKVVLPPRAGAAHLDGVA